MKALNLLNTIAEFILINSNINAFSELNNDNEKDTHSNIYTIR